MRGGAAWIAGMLAVVACTSAPNRPPGEDTDAPDGGGAFVPDGGDAELPDGGTDAGPDGGSDPRPDGGSDGGVDAGTASAYRTWPPVRPGYVNPIPSENLKTGNAAWSRMTKKATREIVGYADHVSAKAGDRVQVMVSSDVPSAARWELWRIGWYGGAGARQVDGAGFSVAPQPECPMSADTGRVQCAWAPSFSLAVTNQHVSGLYLFKLVRADGWASWVPLVIRDERPADLLFQSSVTTWQAYNDWGGASLYSDPTGTLPRGRAVEVSFDRPYSERTGSGQVLRFELFMAQFLEHAGYDVTYTENTALSATSEGELEKRGAFLSVGHDEYWPQAEFDVLTAARDRGMPLLFFSANSAYWRVRLADDRGAGPRTVIGYKEFAKDDPRQAPLEITDKYRNGATPENALLGVMTDAWQNLRFPLVVADDSQFLFRGTGLSTGESIPWLVGYETDRRWDNGKEPPGVVTLASVPVVGVEGTTTRSDTTWYRAKSGALVFATGTIEWSLGLTGGGADDPRVERMTANVFEEALGIVPPANVGTGPVPSHRILGPFAAAVTTVASGLTNPSAVAALPDGSLAVVETSENRVVRVSNAGRQLIAGSTRGAAGWSSDLAGPDAQFSAPAGLVLDAAGDLYLADTGNHCIRRIRLGSPARVTTLAGHCGESGSVDADGAAARFRFPMGLARDPVTGDLLVADSWNHRVRRIVRGTGHTTTEVGSDRGLQDGPARVARLNYPTAVALDDAGRLYVANSGSFTIARMDVDPDRTVTTLAGGAHAAGDGSGLEAGLGPQAGLVFREGVLVVSDAANGRIRSIIPGTDAGATTVRTIAGGRGRTSRDGAGDEAQFALPLGLALGADGSLYVADAAAGKVRRIEP